MTRNEIGGIERGWFDTFLTCEAMTMRQSALTCAECHHSSGNGQLSELNRQCGALVHSGPLQVPTSGSTLPFALMIAYFLASSASLKFDIFCIFAIVEMILNGLYNYSKYFTWFWLIFYLGSYMEKSVIPIYKSQQQGRPSPNSSTSSAAEEPAS